MYLHIQLAKAVYWIRLNSRWISSFFPIEVCSSSFVCLPLTWLSVVLLSGLRVFVRMLMNSRATSCLFSFCRSEVVVVDCFLDCVFDARFSAPEEERGSKLVAMIKVDSDSYCNWDCRSSHVNSCCREARCSWRCVITCENAANGQSRVLIQVRDWPMLGKSTRTSTFGVTSQPKSSLPTLTNMSMVWITVQRYWGKKFLRWFRGLRSLRTFTDT